MSARSIIPPVGLAAAASLVACSPSPAQEGEELFAEACAHCHSPAGTERAPGASVLGQLSPRAIVASLEDGVMRAEGSDLTPEQRVHLAEYLTSRRYTAEALPEAAFCGGPAWTGPGPADASWKGFAGNLAGTGFQSLERAGLDASDVPNLELRWAFAFPDGTNMRTSPAVAGDVAVVAGPYGEVAGPRPGHRVIPGYPEETAVTAIEGVVFAGGLDGVIRAHATLDGRVIWEFDTTRPVETVGGVTGRGGAIDGPGPVVAEGMLFVNSGYGMFGQMPGNLLLAFWAGDSAGSRD